MSNHIAVFSSLNSVAGASPSNTADNNTRLIQAALDSGGVQVLSNPGTYKINDTLSIGSDTSLYLGPDVTIQMVNGINKNMLVTKSYLASNANVTVTWSAGITASVGWTSHGLVVGDYISISNATPSMYLGVFKVITVTDADNVIVVLWRVPSGAASAVSGSIHARKANVNIGVFGGSWDYNYPNNNGSNTSSHCLIIGHCANAIIDTQVNNVAKYTLHAGAIYNFDLKIISNYSGSDGIKVNGPANCGTRVEFSGYCGDDAVSLQTREPNTYASYRWTYGDILDVKGIRSKGYSSAGSIAALYGSANELMDNVVVESIEGTCYAEGIKIWGDTDVATSAAGIFGSLTINGMRTTTTAAASSCGTAIYCTITELRINNCVISNALTSDTSWSFGGITGLIEFDGLVDNGTVAHASNPPVNIGGTCNSLVFKNCVLRKNRLLNIAGTLYLLRVINCDAVLAGSLIYIPAGVAKPNIIMSGNYISLNGSVVRTDSVNGFNLTIIGNVFDNAWEGVARGNAANAPISVYSGGGNILTGSTILFLKSVGSEVVSLYGDDLHADISTIARTTGSHCYNTNAALGTLAAAGLVDCDVTATTGSWHLRTNPALVY